MMRSRTTTVVAAGILVTSMVASVLLVRIVDQSHTAATSPDTLYVSSPKLIRRLSLGYDGLMADLYWTRVVQYFGGVHGRGGGTYKLLWPLLNITTQLDPHLIPAYEFGATFLLAKPPDGAGSPEEAIKLAQYGIENNPGDWQLYYDVAFIYYELKDYRHSAEAFLHASQLPGAHPFLKIMAAETAEHGGDLATARMMWTATYQTTHDNMIRANAAAHLRAVQADTDISALDRLVELYRQRTRKVPSSLSDLVAAGFLRELPLDPNRKPYRLESAGNVVVSDPADLPFLDKGLPQGYVPSPVPKLPPTN
jgi:tetratricopeptide (TPR) repeat protein